MKERNSNKTGAKVVCTHCGHGFFESETKEIVDKRDISCCDDCVDVLLEEGKVIICKDCLSTAMADLRKSLPKGMEMPVRDMVLLLESTAAVLASGVSQLETFEGEHTVLQLLNGGLAEEGEMALQRIFEKGFLLSSELERMAQLYRLFLNETKDNSDR